ncbi:hypothetical protein T492DRAFT_849124 [Pavlovales sp. CCMP2436]|nr:hypothetical protein T492DRAFT_849124 [Pavlovales sp. CCMP2436]
MTDRGSLPSVADAGGNLDRSDGLDEIHSPRSGAAARAAAAGLCAPSPETGSGTRGEAAAADSLTAADNGPEAAPEQDAERVSDAQTSAAGAGAEARGSEQQPDADGKGLADADAVAAAAAEEGEGTPARKLAAGLGAAAAAGTSDPSEDAEGDVGDSELVAGGELPYAIVKLRCRGIREGGYRWDLKSAQPPHDVESSSCPRKATSESSLKLGSSARSAGWHAVTAVATELGWAPGF